MSHVDEQTQERQKKKKKVVAKKKRREPTRMHDGRFKLQASGFKLQGDGLYRIWTLGYFPQLRAAQETKPRSSKTQPNRTQDHQHIREGTRCKLRSACTKLSVDVYEYTHIVLHPCAEEASWPPTHTHILARTSLSGNSPMVIMYSPFRNTSSGCASCLAGRDSVIRSTQNGSGIGQKLVPLLSEGYATNEN